LREVTMRPPKVPVIANVTAAAAGDPAEIRDLLVRQVTGMVRWRESIAAMAAQGVRLFCEVGAGRILTGLVRRSAPAARALALGTQEEISQALHEIQEKAHAV
jgi:[acyl-carrier-protein] S-malonyltransferase